MIRPFIIFLLLVSLIALGRGATSVWRQEVTAAVETSNDVATAAAPEKKIDFNPPVPASLPDLRQNYLFNEARLSTRDDPDNAAEDGTVDDIIFIGSIISGDLHRGMVSYPVVTAPAKPKKGGRHGTAAAKAAVSQRYEVLSPGDKFRGYEVDEVRPEAIVFIKNDQKTTKTLRGADKKRLEPPPLPGSEPEQPPAAASDATGQSKQPAKPATKEPEVQKKQTDL